MIVHVYFFTSHLRACSYVRGPDPDEIQESEALRPNLVSDTWSPKIIRRHCLIPSCITTGRPVLGSRQFYVHLSSILEVWHLQAHSHIHCPADKNFTLPPELDERRACPYKGAPPLLLPSCPPLTSVIGSLSRPRLVGAESKNRPYHKLVRRVLETLERGCVPPPLPYYQ